MIDGVFVVDMIFLLLLKSISSHSKSKKPLAQTQIDWFEINGVSLCLP